MSDTPSMTDGEFAAHVAERYRQLMAALEEADHDTALNRIGQLKRCEAGLNALMAVLPTDWVYGVLRRRRADLEQ